MIWDCFAWDGLDSLLVCESERVGMEEYIKTLVDELLSFIDDILGPTDDASRVRTADNFIFTQDGGLCHKATVVT